MNQQQMQDTTSAFRTTEEFEIREREFIDYIEDEVNPARRTAGLLGITDSQARACFRVLDKFFVHWRGNGIAV